MKTIFLFIRKYPIVILFFLAVFVLHLSVIMPSGTYWCFQNRGCGLVFWGSHEHDGIWHLTLIKNAFNNLPFMTPNMAGVSLAGYNFLLDLILFIIWKLGLDPLISLFKLAPILWVLFYGGIIILFGVQRNKGWLYTTLVFLFTLLGGSFGYVLTLYKNHTLIGSAVNTAMQSVQTLTNLQFAFSLIFILATLYILSKPKIMLKDYILVCLFLFMVIGLKFYGGIILGGTLFVYGMGKLVKQNIQKQHGVYFLVSIIVTAAVALVLFYNPFQSFKSGSSLVFKPFSLINPIIEDPSLFYSQKWTLARYFLEASGRVSPRLLAIYLCSFILFVIFNFGTRVFGMMYLNIRILRGKATLVEAGISAGIFIALIMTTFFVQKGEWWNTIQFLYYAFFLSAILLADFVYMLLVQKNWWLTICALLIIVATLPINYDFLQFSFSKPSSIIVQGELDALSFLQKQPRGTVFTAPFNSKAPRVGTNPFPVYLSGDTTYVSAFSEKPLYVADIVQLKLIGAPYLPRLEKAQKYDCSILKEVKYIYEIKGQGIKNKFKPCKTVFYRIFKNKTASIYKVSSQ